MRKRLTQIIDEFGGHRIAVIGDLIADEFLFGEISRISREAPVLVVQYKDLVRVPGGAANAANNLLDLGCSVTVAGLIGDDEAGRDIAAQLSAKGADTSTLHRSRGCSTPVKTRILAAAHHSTPQQIVRVDRVVQFSEEAVSRLIPAWRLPRRCDGLIVSDYGCGAVSAGLFSALRAQARARAIPVVVDSRFAMSRFAGVTAMTPNITELEAATGISIGGNGELLDRTARDVLRKQKLACLLVTQGKYGMTLVQRRRPAVHIPIFGTDEVADVTGAGDTVIAVFTLALACGASAEEAARLANYAGGIVVMKRGTATLTPDELRAAVRQDLPANRAAGYGALC
jgi:rfaE bifunctional protein kinase chain/domain